MKCGKLFCLFDIQSYEKVITTCPHTYQTAYQQIIFHVSKLFYIGFIFFLIISMELASCSFSFISRSIFSIPCLMVE